MGKFLKTLLIALVLSTLLWAFILYFVFIEKDPKFDDKEIKFYCLAISLAHVLLLANWFFVTRDSALRYVVYAPYTAYFLYFQPAQPALKKLLAFSPLGKEGTLIAAAALAALAARLFRLSPFYALLYNSLFLIPLGSFYLQQEDAFEYTIAHFWRWGLPFLGIALLLDQVLSPFVCGKRTLLTSLLRWPWRRVSRSGGSTGRYDPPGYF